MKGDWLGKLERDPLTLARAPRLDHISGQPHGQAASGQADLELLEREAAALAFQGQGSALAA